ncbi:Sjogren's syndrome/scleroderma autoantigen 1 family protein [Haloplanus sp. GCM10025708]|uniref:Sjogren's syndrome/scleroderma autoantigen 1 family protein n=1 Tax=Haloferacaceae TaxID=1644056 RepID=UPI003612193A
MSGFDKEAERERLREKYEKDQEKREATQRMSELLLQGATMTNRHCDQCGDPIFRYEGQEFCPTCQTTTGGEGEESAAEATQTAQAPETQANGQAVEAETPTGGERPEPTATESAHAGGEPATESEPERPRRGEPTPEPTRPPTPQRASSEGEASVERARASLVRTLTRFAEAAETADDPRRAKELLGAAREAAETLDAVDR